MKTVKSFADYSKNIINESKSTDEQFEELYQKLVPHSGSAKTVEGELLRSIARLIYRYNNAGDYFFGGYGKETAGPSAKYLKAAGIPGLASTITAAQKQAEKHDHADNYTENDGYLNNLNLAMEIIVNYVIRKNGKYEENTTDSR